MPPRRPDHGPHAVAGQEQAFSRDSPAPWPPSACAAAGITLLDCGGTGSTRQ